MGIGKLKGFLGPLYQFTYIFSFENTFKEICQKSPESICMLKDFLRIKMKNQIVRVLIAVYIYQITLVLTPTLMYYIMTSWDIVFFLRDNTSEYVPTSWAVDTKKDVYLWPKKLSETQIKKLRDNCSEPSLNIEYEEWDGICKATVFTLKHAQNLAEKAEYISNLSVDETDVEGLVIDDKDNNNTVDDEEDEVSGDNVESVGHKLKNKTGRNYNYSTNRVTTPSGFKGYSSSQRNLIYSFTKTPKSSKSLINGPTKTTTSDSTNEGLADNNISRDIKKITKALAGIKYDITDMKNNISHIKIKLDMLENKSKSFKSTSDFKLPLTTPQQLLELENKIENATDLEDLVNILSHVGGDTVKRIYIL
ncbi:hypothetical protein NQ318_002539 [Aromia moschata]|uniref:Uncharacterized protein n=1 Tax=Aromia moschata TaxID=1265417 RepID=A0AAV8Y3N1_9CUCU|nr:hypothetical protein NQ318_002539 [Aromia moschata]